MNGSHLAIGMNMAPGAAHDDGSLRLSFVRQSNSCQMIGLLLSLDDKGTLITANQPFVETHDVLAFRLEPDADDPLARYGHITLDGEVLPYGPIQGQVHAGLLRVFGVPSR